MRNLKYINSYAVKATVNTLFDEDSGSYIQRFDEFEIVEFDKELGFNVEIIDDSEIKFEEPNECSRD